MSLQYKFGRKGRSYVAKRTTGLWKKPMRRTPWMSRPRKSLTARVNELSRSQELKWYDSAITNMSDILQPINSIPLGDDSITRDGRKIQMKSLQIRCLISQVATTGFPAGTRIIVVYDNATNGLLPNVTDVVTTSVPTAGMNLNNRSRFVVVYDSNNLSSGTAPPLFTVPVAGTGIVNWWINKYIKLDHTVIYKDTGSGTVAGTVSGGLFAFCLGNVAGSLNFRVRFHD